MSLETAIFQVVASYFATIAFSILCNINKKKIFIGGFSGALGWASYLIGMYFLNSLVLATFLASFIVGLMSLRLAVIFKTPATIFRVLGVVPIVPGLGMYKILYSASIMEYNQSIFFFFETMQTAGAIALGLLLANTFRKLFEDNKKS